MFDIGSTWVSFGSRSIYFPDSSVCSVFFGSSLGCLLGLGWLRFVSDDGGFRPGLGPLRSILFGFGPGLGLVRVLSGSVLSLIRDWSGLHHIF